MLVYCTNVNAARSNKEKTKQIIADFPNNWVYNVTLYDNDTFLQSQFPLDSLDNKVKYERTNDGCHPIHLHCMETSYNEVNNESTLIKFYYFNS